MGAVARGLIAESYIDMALSSASDVEVPLAPAANLVLWECSFRDGAFRPHGACQPLEVNDISLRLREAIVTEISGKASMAAFTAFVRELDEEIGPRLQAAEAVFEIRAPQ